MYWPPRVIAGLPGSVGGTPPACMGLSWAAAKVASSDPAKTVAKDGRFMLIPGPERSLRRARLQAYRIEGKPKHRARCAQKSRYAQTISFAKAGIALHGSSAAIVMPKLSVAPARRDTGLGSC